MRETFAPFEIISAKDMKDPGTVAGKGYFYKADGMFPIGFVTGEYKWKPSIFMPKEACRLFLRITKIKAERLQDISPEDAKKEGVPKAIYHMGTQRFETVYEDHVFYKNGTYKSGFENIWININGKNSWEENPTVWIIEFEKIEKSEEKSL